MYSDNSKTAPDQSTSLRWPQSPALKHLNITLTVPSNWRKMNSTIISRTQPSLIATEISFILIMLFLTNSRYYVNLRVRWIMRPCFKEGGWTQTFVLIWLKPASSSTNKLVLTINLNNVQNHSLIKPDFRLPTTSLLLWVATVLLKANMSLLGLPLVNQ
jgi:hypothetical protein